jgi:hypothetical protein
MEILPTLVRPIERMRLTEQAGDDSLKKNDREEEHVLARSQ